MHSCKTHALLSARQEESQTLPSNQARYIELVVKEKIFNAILNALELQLELKLPNIGFDHI